MSYLEDRIMKLTRQLYPRGRAWKLPFGGKLERLHKALGKSEARALADGKSLLDSLLPDNDGFTAEDAVMWEGKLGIITGSGVSLADRKLRIARKIFAPGNVRPRQHYLYVQSQLRAAGFDVYVYENRFDDGMGGYETRTPSDVLGIAIADAVLDGFDLDEAELDGEWADAGITILANHLYAADDAGFGIGPNYRTTFYVSGDPITTFATVPAGRMDEFRQLLLMLKPAQTVGFLFVNYV